jgi:hypothetical protein
MLSILNAPALMFAVSLVLLLGCARAGARLARYAPHGREAQQELGMVLAGSLTLLGLIIGFSFSMATSRYDMRKNYEEAEANAIGTEFLRADLLPPAAAARARALLRDYLAERIAFYDTRDNEQLLPIMARTTQTQSALWAIVRDAARDTPTTPMALTVMGMNDVINSQGYTQAAWWNRIPWGAWTLMGLIAVLCNLMFGFTAHHLKSRALLMSVLPFLLAVAFCLIADIDSPRGGVIHVAPQNLLALAPTLH